MLVAPASGGRFDLAVAGVRLERPRRSELTELMTDHIFGNKNGIKNLSVMNQKRVADKIRRHH